MARPTTKNDLVNQGIEKYNKLIELIDSIPKDKQTDVFNFSIEKEKGEHWKRDKNIRDVLIHLYEWHILLLNWINNNQHGIEKQFLQEGYNWKTYGKMNISLWNKHQNTSYTESLKLLDDSHLQVLKIMETFSNDELFSKNVFKWVGGSTLGSYFASATSSHYDWAIKKIKKYKKSL